MCIFTFVCTIDETCFLNLFIWAGFGLLRLQFIDISFQVSIMKGGPEVRSDGLDGVDSVLDSENGVVLFLSLDFLWRWGWS